jgi:DNA-binding transcriptional LysR family regulator
MVCVLRRGHPRARGRLSLRSYLELEHVMVASTLPPVSSIDEALHRLGKTRTVVARVPTAVAALMLAAASDVAATSYARAVPHLHGSVVALPLPFKVPPLTLHLMWHPRSTVDPFHRWIRDGIANAVGDQR